MQRVNQLLTILILLVFASAGWFVIVQTIISRQNKPTPTYRIPHFRQVGALQDLEPIPTPPPLLEIDPERTDRGDQGDTISLKLTSNIPTGHNFAGGEVFTVRILASPKYRGQPNNMLHLESIRFPIRYNNTYLKLKVLPSGDGVKLDDTNPSEDCNFYETAEPSVFIIENIDSFNSFYFHRKFPRDNPRYTDMTKGIQLQPNTCIGEVKFQVIRKEQIDPTKLTSPFINAKVMIPNVAREIGLDGRGPEGTNPDGTLIGNIDLNEHYEWKISNNQVVGTFALGYHLKPPQGVNPTSNVPSDTPTPTSPPATATPPYTPTPTNGGGNSPTPTPTGGAGATATPTPTLGPLAMIEREAEQYTTIITPMVTSAVEPSASACRFVTDPIGWNQQQGGGSVTYSMSVAQAGNYWIWARVRGVDATHNSFFVKVDNLPTGDGMHFEISPSDNQWHWQGVYEVDQQSMPFSLSAGTHTIKFIGREAPGSDLDKILLVNQSNYTPDDAHHYSACTSGTPTSTPTGGVTGTPTPTPNGMPNYIGTISYGTDSPAFITSDSNGWIYVTDSSHKVKKYDTLGNYSYEWGGQGAANGQFQLPAGVEFFQASGDPNGTIYVADYSNNRVQKFGIGGDFLGKWGTQGTNAGEFFQPMGVAAGPSGAVYVADTFNNRVQKFFPDGVFVREWGGFNRPHDITTGTVNDTTYIFVADTNHNQIKKFDTDGQLLDTWGSSGSIFLGPLGIGFGSVGSTPYVYVADTESSRIVQLTPDGVLVSAWGSLGSGHGQFRGPSDVTATVIGNVTYIHVVDRGNNRVEIFAYPAGSQGNMLEAQPVAAAIVTSPTPTPYYIDMPPQNAQWPLLWVDPVGSLSYTIPINYDLLQVNDTYPDLTVESMELYSDPEVATCTIELQTKIKNIGQTAALPFTVMANSQTYRVLSGLAAGQELTLRFSDYHHGTMMDPNVVRVDSNSEISEVREDNNILERFLFLGSITRPECQNITPSGWPYPTGGTGTGTGSATLTSVPLDMSKVNISLRLKLQGVRSDTFSQQYSHLRFGVAVGAVGKETTEYVKSDFAYKGAGIYEGIVTFDPTKVLRGSTYKLLVKGPKHLAKRFCTAQASGNDYFCAENAGAISLAPGLQRYDYSTVSLAPGDLPLDGFQDGVVDSSDLSYIRQNLPSKVADVLRVGDLNLDGIVDTQDFSLVINNLVNNEDER